MAVQVLMPSLGESVEEGVLTKWLKTKGEAVEEFEPLIEVNTDKVDTEVPSPASGILLEILVEENSTIQAGQVLALIGEPGEQLPMGESGEEVTLSARAGSVSEIAKKEIPQQPAASRPEIIKSRPGRDETLGFISPVVAKIASEQNVDLSQVHGSGQYGRITKMDIQTFLQERDQVDIQVSRAHEPALAYTTTEDDIGELLPHSAVRRTIAKHMVHSKRTSPHVTTVMEVDLSSVIAHRERNKESFASDGARLTFTPYFVAASVAALRTYPIVNSSWSDEGIIIHRQINIGMATSLGEEGLIVPVIRNADKLSLLGFASTVNDLANRARAHQLEPDEVHGGTFTITNHGISGSLFATPIINQPQCAILGVGTIQKRVVVISEEHMGDTIAIRPMAYLSLTFDHRILDGANGDYFLAKIVDELENWS